MSSGKLAIKDAHRKAGRQERRPAAPEQPRGRPAFEAEVTARLGLLPDAFRPPDGAPEVTDSLWAFAKAAWLDNPLPTLFKERLFVHLSRFCPGRYCIVRHTGFLLGRGNPAGDPAAPRHTVEQVAELLSRPGRLEGADLDAALSRLAAVPESGVPEPESRTEADVFAAATELFLSPEDTESARDALDSILGPRNFGLLLAFFAFIRATHYWTSVRRLEPEEDVECLLRDHRELARLLTKQPNGKHSEVRRRLRNEITLLRRERDARTEAARSAEMLRESEARLKLALEAADLGVWDYDLTTGLSRSHSLRHDQMFGYHERQPSWSREKVERHILEEDRPRFREAFAEAEKTGRLSFEARVRWPDGSIHWIAPQAQTICDAHGNPLRMIGIVRDITEQKQSDESLRRKSEMLNAIIDNVPVMIGVYDSGGKVLFLNEEFKRTSGWPTREGPDFSVLKDCYPDAEYRKEISEFMESGCGWKDIRMKARDGRTIETAWSNVPLSGDRKVGIGLDMTERKAAEKALRESEERLAAALRAGKLGIYDYYPRSGAASWDETTRRLWGVPADEPVTWETFAAGVHPDDLPAVEEAVRAAFDPEGPGVYAGDYRVINRQNGEVRWIHAEGDVTFENGRAVRLVGTVLDVTQRRLSEEALAESEQRFRKMADGAPVMIWVTEHDGSCTYINRRWMEFTGQSDEAGLGYGWLDAVHPDDRKRVHNQYAAATESRSEFRIDYRLRRKDGVYRWAIDAAQPRFDADGRFLGFIGSVLDITESKEAELALREREERLKAVLSAADLGAWHWNVQADAGEVNRRYAEMLGYDLDEFELSFDAFISLVHPDDRERVQTSLQEHFEGKTDIYGAEIRMRHKDGRWIWVLASGRVIEWDGAGRPLIMTGIHQDISGRLEAIQALRESEERFRHLANAAPVLIWMSGPDKLCTWFNKPWMEFVGRTMEEELGNGWTENVHPDDLDHSLETYSTAFDAHEPFSMEYRLRRHDGQYRWLLDKGIPRYGPAGEFTGYVGTCLDITENKEIEFALRQREERLAAVLRAADLGLWHWDIQFEKAELNQRYAQMIGYDLSEIEPTFDTFIQMVHPDDAERVKKSLREHFEGKTDLYSLEVRMRHKDGHWIWIATSGRVIERDSAGRPLVMTGIHQDISGRIKAVEALRESEEQFRLLADNMSQFAWMADATGWIYWYNKRWFDYTGTTLEEMQGWGWRKVPHPDHVKRVVGKIAQSFATGEAWEDTFPLRSRDGNYRWFLSRALPIRDDRGRVVRWFGTNTDITERLRAEQHRELLMNELNHRVKNTLAIVQGIARQTFRDDGNALRELTQSFQNRLAALAGAHNLLTRSSWEATSLEDLTIASVNSGCAQKAAVHIDGPHVMLTPKQAITFAMALHELCTNATKYGALSVQSGRINITWAVSNGGHGRRLKLVWREHGGPLVKPPLRRGFGLRMIEQALAAELGGKAALEFRPEGFVCTIEGTLEGYERGGV